MAQVAVLVRVTPEDCDKVNDLVEKIKGKLNPIEIGTEEIGFGIKVVRALFYVDESRGSSYLEEELQKIENVSNVDVLSVDRLG